MKNKNKEVIYFIFFIILFSEQIPVLAIENFIQKPARVSVQLTQKYYLSTDEIEQIFRQYLQPGKYLKYAKVPQGLIVSIDSAVFFENGNSEILEQSKHVLDLISDVIKQLDKECIVEGNTNTTDNSNLSYNWELAMMRADSIVNYLIKVKKVNSKNIKSVGFGEIAPMPPYIGEMNNRIDFVIINYEQAAVTR